MPKDENNPLKRISGIKVIYPVIIGLGVISFFLYKNYNPKAFASFSFSFKMVFFLFLAVCFMAIRDIGYMFRIRVLTNKDLSWKQAFRVIMLWEFSSSVLPSAVGGTTIAWIFVNKEGINLGRSTAVVMATSFLDELYFVIMFPLLMAVISIPKLFTVGVGVHGDSVFSLTNEFLWFAVIGYSLKFIFIIILGYGLFINPRGLKWLLLVVFKLPFLRKFRPAANITGNEIITSSEELKRQKLGFWLKAFGGTFISWSARYLVVNALLLAFFSISDHFLLFARQLVMQNIMLIFPTPGGSGFSEYIFTSYLKDFIPVSVEYTGAIIIVIAFLWRLVSYYPYLIIGSIILPSWIKNKFRFSGKTKKTGV
jgi:glycosyltransferase 2 family protein